MEIRPGRVCGQDTGVLAEWRCIQCIFTWAAVVGSKVISVPSDFVFDSCDMLLITCTVSAFMSILHGHSLSLMPLVAQVGEW